jgi:lipopolysaccharide export system protein LptC
LVRPTDRHPDQRAHYRGARLAGVGKRVPTVRAAALLVGIAAISLGALLWYRFEQTRGPSLPAPQDASDASIPDYFVNGMRVTTMAPDGRPARTLRAVHLQHFVDQATTELSAPHLTIYQDEQPPWEITADRGRLTAGGELVLLQGDVEIVRQGDTTTRPVRLRTRNLRIEPSKDYAETDEPVYIVSREDRVEAVGMQAWLRAPARIRLLNKARGHYVPH